MRLKSLSGQNLNGRTVLYRAPYDIETQLKDDKYLIKDDTRIKRTLPTLNFLLSQNCKIVILTWVGRPKSGFENDLSTKPHAEALSIMLKQPVIHVNGCIEPEINSKIRALKDREILMLENSRFYKEDYEENHSFAEKLCEGCDYIVFDGFPQAHRAVSSTSGILKILPSCAGMYFEEEYNSLQKLLDKPEKPFTVVIGGAKISDKIDAITNFYNIADIILVGGGLANAFLKAEGKNLGNSYVEEKVSSTKDSDKNILAIAHELIEKGHKNTPDLFEISENTNLGKIVTPIDFVVGKQIDNDSEHQVVNVTESSETIQDGWAAYDIGPRTTNLFKEIISQSKTVFWAGPLGVYEQPNYSLGTKTVAEELSNHAGNTIIAGGDTIDALNQFGNAENISHVSLAGGATIEFLSGNQLPVINYLKDTAE